MIKLSKCVQLIFLWISIPSIVMTATIYGNPGTRTFNENDDPASDMWTVSATCYPSNNDYILGIKVGTTSHTVACETCTWNDPSSGLFLYSGNVISKKACTDTDCGDCQSCTACSTANGCLSGPTSYSITVTCSTTSYDNDDSGSSTLTVSVTDEESISTLAISLPASVSADNSMSVNTVLTTASQSSGPAIVQYRKSSGVAASHILSTADLFDFNSGNGEVYIRTDPSAEYDNTYSMGICIYSRRQTSCATLTINFDGCYQTPYCDDQTDNSFSDEIAVGTTLFTMTANAGPTAHFAAFDSTWRNLDYVITSSTLSEATIDAATGVITTTGNVTVWPDYPYSSHTIVVEVSNPGLDHSCSYTSTCTLSSQFSFTNWPIRFENLPTTRNHHEDLDARTLVLTIITYDHNNPAHDNVTCVETGNEEPTLLELEHRDGNFDYNSWSIYKKVCTDAGCGYIEENFLCDEGIGCLNYDLDKEYTIDIRCSDAYGSDVEATFTLAVTENKPPVYSNTPTTIILDTDSVAQHIKVFSIYYTDAEFESLEYNFTQAPSSPSLFTYDSLGNYHDNPSNVTAIIFQWNLQNMSFNVDFCGRERRNIVCSSFTIDIRDNCGPTPVCTDATTTVTDQTVVNTELFQIDVTGSGYTSLTYVIITEHSDLFSVNQNTGQVTTIADLQVKHPPASITYHIVANVYDSAACAVAACLLSVTVEFTNFDITIDNMGSVEVDIHEDETDSVHIVTIETSDDNSNDGVTCEVKETLSTPANNNIFSAVETDVGSNVYELVSKEGPGFDYDTTSTYKVVVVCEDNYDSSDTATATVNILENQEPTMDNLNAGDVINVDPITMGTGTTIFTLQTSDDENDALTYSCNVTNSFVPLECLSDGVVSLRRDVRVPDEDGDTYSITLCIEDPVHDHTVCETLSVLITSSKTNPVLDNLPDSVSFPENSAINTTIFTVTVYDPDALDVHTFHMTVYPKTSSSTFSLDANAGVLTLAESLDYELQTNYVVRFNVTDTYLPGLVEKYLSISITDVNEAPTLTMAQTVYSTIEEDSGYTVATLDFTCTDVDKGQTMSLAISSGTYLSFFSLDPSTGVLTYAQNWDFENGVVPPQTATLGIICDDGNGLSDSEDIVVNVSPVNEFPPVLTTSRTTEDIVIYNTQTLLDPLFTITATDADFGDDGVFDYSILGNGKGSRYFTINSSGQLFISNYMTWNYNRTFDFTVQVSDGESDPLASTVHVVVMYVAPDPDFPLPTKESAKCILCTRTGRAVVASLCVEGFLILIFVIHACCRMKAYQICLLKPKPRLQTVMDIKREIRRKQLKGVETEDPYPLGIEMSDRNLPKKRPPSPFSYNVPKDKGKATPPAAAIYLPPKPANNLAKSSDPTDRTRPTRMAKVNTARDRTDKQNATIHPSLFREKAYAPQGLNQTEDGTDIYRHTPDDPLAPPIPLTNVRNASMFARYREDPRDYPTNEDLDGLGF